MFRLITQISIEQRERRAHALAGVQIGIAFEWVAGIRSGIFGGKADDNVPNVTMIARISISGDANASKLYIRVKNRTDPNRHSHCERVVYTRIRVN